MSGSLGFVDASEKAPQQALPLRQRRTERTFAFPALSSLTLRARRRERLFCFVYAFFSGGLSFIYSSIYLSTCVVALGFVLSIVEHSR